MYEHAHHLHDHGRGHIYPCLHCHPHSYIRMVQQLIERCLIFHMSRDQCIKTLADHASIRPLVTLTVWKELQKENKDFFESYFHGFFSPNRPYMSKNTTTFTNWVDVFKGHPGLQEENDGCE